MSPPRPSLEEARVFLAGRDVDPRAVDVAGEGAWSRCFGFGEHVIRFGAQLEDFEKDHRAAAFARTDLPVPEVLEIGEAFGQFYAISTRVRGEVLEHSPTWEPIGPSFFAMLDALRSVDISNTSGFGLWDRSGRGRHDSWRAAMLDVVSDVEGRRLVGWKEKLGSDPPAQRLFAECVRRIGSLADATPPDVRCLVHSDLINRNVLVAGDRISGVFDWGCSLYGDFLYELAWIEFWESWYPGLEAFGLRDRARRHLAAIGLEVPDFDARITCAALHIGAHGLAYRAFQGGLGDEPRVFARISEYLDAASPS